MKEKDTKSSFINKYVKKLEKKSLYFKTRIYDEDLFKPVRIKGESTGHDNIIDIN
jgi:hypothetical protein